MLRCLTIDPMVARPSEGGPSPVQLKPLCLFNLDVGTHPGFAAPFHPNPTFG